MSLYNMLFGRNPYSKVLLALLGLTEGDCGRFRDCYPNEDGTEIHIYTRNGGGNREEYQDTIDALAARPGYLRDFDDDFDCTYATIVFAVPVEAKAIVARIADQTDTTPPMEKFFKLLADMDAGKDNAVVSRALEVGKQIFGALEANQSKTIATPEGAIKVIAVTPNKL